MSKNKLPEPFSSSLKDFGESAKVGLTLKFPVKPEKKAAFLKVIGELDEKSKTMKGLEVFTVNAEVFPTPGETNIILYEVWTNKDCLAAQLASSHVSEFRDALMAGDFLAGEYRLEIFQILH